MSTASRNVTPDVGSSAALRRPIFVVAPPRSGGRLIADALAAAHGTWTINGGAGAFLAGVPALDPADGRNGGRLVAEHCDAAVREQLLAHLRMQATARRGPGGLPPRLYDASPRNALMVPFLRAVFPDATFVYVHRRPLDALAESMTMWRAGTAVTYPALPGWPGPPWSFLLVPGWQKLIGLPLAEVVTEQWVRTMETLLIDLEALPPTSWCVTEHDALLASPRAELERLLEFLGVDLSYPAVRAVGLAMHRQPSGSEPRAAQDALGPYVRRTEQLAARARDWIAKVPDSGENT